MAKRKKIATKKKTKKKKKTKRSQAKYPALDPQFSTRNRKEYHDINGYHFPLDEESKKWLNDFMEGHLNASFKDSNKHLFKTKAQKKKSYDANNARNRDLYGISKINNLIEDVTVVTTTDFQKSHSDGYNLTEEAMIAELDRKYDNVDDSDEEEN